MLKGEQPDDEEVFALLASLKRIFAFYSCHDLSNWELWEELYQVLEMANRGANIHEDVRLISLLSLSFSLFSLSVLLLLSLSLSLSFCVT